MYLFSLGIYQVRIMHSWQPRPNATIYYRRGIPQHLRASFDNKTHFTKSTGTNDPKVAAKQLERINREFEALLEAAKRPGITKNHIRELEEFLAGWELDIRGRGDEEIKSILLEELADKIRQQDPEGFYEGTLTLEQRREYREKALTPVESLALSVVGQGLRLKVSDYVQPHLEYKGKVGNRKFTNDLNKAVNDMVDLLGDKPPSEYSRYDMNRLIKHWLKTVSTGTVHKRLGLLRAMFNKVNQELEISESHPFHNWDIPNYGEDKVEREDFTIEQLRAIAKIKPDDDINRITLIMMDTGLRVSEVLGLSAKELRLDAEVPYISLNKNPFRRLKTKNSVRVVPLVGKALEAVQSVADSEEWLFPRYLDHKAEKFKNDAASTTVNNRLERLLGEDAPTAHSFRHTMTTALRNVDCPKDIREELAGWRSGVSELYGSPTDLVKKAGYLRAAIGLRE